MTGRGKAGAPPQRPVTPLDPTLSTRPVPLKRIFSRIISFGPAADPSSWASFTPIHSLIERLASTPSSGTSRDPDSPFVLDGVFYDPTPTNEIVRLLQESEDWTAVSYRSDEAPVEPNPTWGFRLFLTSYDAVTRERLDNAVQNLVEVTRRALLSSSRVIFAEEAFKRLCFEVVDDEEKLANASEDRIRAEFRALVRGLEITDEDSDVVPPPARNVACLVLDQESVAMLAALEFDDSGQDKMRIKVLDVLWKRPESSAKAYRGIGLIPIRSLPRLYMELSVDGWMEKLGLWQGAPDHLSIFE